MPSSKVLTPHFFLPWFLVALVCSVPCFGLWLLACSIARDSGMLISDQFLGLSAFNLPPRCPSRTAFCRPPLVVPSIVARAPRFCVQPSAACWARFARQVSGQVFVLIGAIIIHAPLPILISKNVLSAVRPGQGYFAIPRGLPALSSSYIAQ